MPGRESASKTVDGDVQTLAFLFTDLEGSTSSWQAEPEAMAAALAAHDKTLTAAFEGAGGSVFKHTGDGILATFPTAEAAVSAAIDAQQNLRTLDWGPLDRRPVRMAVHMGPATARDGDWFGPTLNRTARILGVIAGDQVVLSAAAADQVADAGIELVDLGRHTLRDIARPEQLFAVQNGGLSVAVPTSAHAQQRGLPRLRTSVVGRTAEAEAVANALTEQPIVTIVGPGGVGKTTLAVVAAKTLEPNMPGGVTFVELGEVDDPSDVAPAVANSLGVDLARSGSDPGAVIDRIANGWGEARTLVVLDNCEHVVEECADLVDELVDRCDGLTVLATSRESLGIDGEVTYRLAPLDTSDDGDALTLFVDRLTRGGERASLDAEQRAAAADLCRRLDGLPLAIELAAGQAAKLPLTEIAARLDRDLTALAGGRRRLSRQRTLETTIAWSHDLLTFDERALLRRLSVFVGRFDLSAARDVAAFGEIADADVAALLGRLVDQSLVIADDIWSTRPYRLLETVRVFGASQLYEHGESEDAIARHRDHHLRRLAMFDALTVSADLDAVAELTTIEADVRVALASAISSGELDLVADAFPALASHANQGGGVAALERAMEALQPWMDHQTDDRKLPILGGYLFAGTGTRDIDIVAERLERVAALSVSPHLAVFRDSFLIWGNVMCDVSAAAQISRSVVDRINTLDVTESERGYLRMVVGVGLMVGSSSTEARRQFEIVGDLYYAPVLLATLCYMDGDISEARRAIAGAERLPQTTQFVAARLVIDAAVSLAEGDRQATDRLVKDLHEVAERFPDTRLRNSTLVTLAELARIDGRPEDAYRLLRSTGRYTPTMFQSPLEAVLMWFVIENLQSVLPKQTRDDLRAEGTVRGTEVLVAAELRHWKA